MGGVLRCAGAVLACSWGSTLSMATRLQSFSPPTQLPHRPTPAVAGRLPLGGAAGCGPGGGGPRAALPHSAQPAGVQLIMAARLFWWFCCRRAAGHTGWGATTVFCYPTNTQTPNACPEGLLHTDGCRAAKDGGLWSRILCTADMETSFSVHSQGCSTLTDAGLEKMGCLTSLAALNLSECPGE